MHTGSDEAKVTSSSVGEDEQPRASTEANSPTLTSLSESEDTVEHNRNGEQEAHSHANGDCSHPLTPAANNNNHLEMATLKVADPSRDPPECLPLLSRPEKNGSAKGLSPRRTSLRFQISPEQESNGAAAYQQQRRYYQQQQQRRQSQASGNGHFRRKRSSMAAGGNSCNGASSVFSTSYRRWSSRRRFSNHRRQSRLPSDDLEEIALMQQSSGQVGFQFSCLTCLPLRPHGLCIAALACVVSFAGLLCSASLILRNVVLEELATLPPGCSGYVRNASLNTSSYSLPHQSDKRHVPLDEPPPPVIPQRPPSVRDGNTGTFMLKNMAKARAPPTRVNCSAYSTFIYLVGYSLQGRNHEPAFDQDLGPVAEFIFLSRSFLWCCAGVSAVFLWSAANLFSGIWNYKRRRLVPWLLLTGVTVLFFIMSSFWFLICNTGWHKLVSLVPSGLALLFLYWWILINDLLEEINEEKKAEAYLAATTYASEGMPITTTAIAAAAAAVAAEESAIKIRQGGNSRPQVTIMPKRELTLV